MGSPSGEWVRRVSVPWYTDQLHPQFVGLAMSSHQGQGLNGFGTNATSFTSTLSGTAAPALNGTMVECFGPANNVNPGNLVGKGILKLKGQCVFTYLEAVVECTI